MNRTWKWLAVAGCVVVLGTVAGRVHFARAAEEFQPPALAPRVGTEIDERGVAKLSVGWGVHVPSSILLTAMPPRNRPVNEGKTAILWENMR